MLEHLIENYEQMLDCLKDCLLATQEEMKSNKLWFLFKALRCELGIEDDNSMGNQEKFEKARKKLNSMKHKIEMILKIQKQGKE